MRKAAVSVTKYSIAMIIISVFQISNCSSSKDNFVKSTFKIKSIVSGFFVDYDVIVAESAYEKEFIIISEKRCEIDSADLKYEKIETGKIYDMNVNVFNNTEPLELYIRSPRGELEFHIDMDTTNTDSLESLIWKGGKFVKKVYHSPDICGMNIIRK